MSRTAYIATPSIIKLVTRTEAKSHLRIPSGVTDDDTYIDNLVLAAQECIEEYCNIILFDTEIVQYADKWEDTYNLYKSPVENSGKATIDKIEYIADGDTSYTTWDSSKYVKDVYTCPIRIGLADDEDYPDLADVINAIKITYDIGYSSSSDAPNALKQACLILVGQWYENRQEAIVGRSVGIIPLTARYILDKYKIRTFGLPN